MAEHPQASTSDATPQARSQPPEAQGGESARQAPTPEQRRRRRRIALIAGIAVLLIAALLALWYLLFERGRVSTDDAYTDGRAISMSAKVSGYVVALAITDNQFVRAGDLLLAIDPRDYRNAFDGARGQLEQVRAQLDGARLSVQVARTAQPSDLVSARAALATARANYVRAHADAERERQVDPRATTQSRIDQTLAQEQATGMQVREAQAQVHTAQLAPQNIAIAEAQVRTLEGQLAGAEAQLRQSELNLGYAQLRAPQDGRITKRAVEAGDFVQPGQALLDLVTPEVWITANFKENQLTDMRAGQPVEIRVDAYPQLRLRGHVDSIQMGSGSRFTAFPSENATGNFVKIVQRVPVKILIDSGLPANWALPLGLSVEPTVDERVR